jgi:hypothetical protein
LSLDATAQKNRRRGGGDSFCGSGEPASFLSSSPVERTRGSTAGRTASASALHFRDTGVHAEAIADRAGREKI